MNTVEALKRQNASKWDLVVDGTGEYKGGLYCNEAVTLTLKGEDDNEEDFSFIAGQFVPFNIKEVVAGATGNNVIGLN